MWCRAGAGSHEACCVRLQRLVRSVSSPTVVRQTQWHTQPRAAAAAAAAIAPATRVVSNSTWAATVAQACSHRAHPRFHRRAFSSSTTATVTPTTVPTATATTTTPTAPRRHLFAKVVAGVVVLGGAAAVAASLLVDWRLVLRQQLDASSGPGQHHSTGLDTLRTVAVIGRLIR